MKGDGFVEEPVTIDEGLFGIVTRSTGATGGVWVVFVHGWGGYRAGPHRLFVTAARLLAADGVSSLRFDLPGRGDSAGVEDAVTIDDMIDAVVDAAAFVRNEFSPRALVLCGICSGANVAAGAAVVGGGVDGLILLSMPLFVEQKRRCVHRLRAVCSRAVEYVRKAFSLDTWKRFFRGDVNLRRVGSGIVHAGSDLPQQVSRRDIPSGMMGYKGEMLFVYGGNDPSTPGAAAEFERLAGAHAWRAVFAEIPFADHNYCDPAAAAELVSCMRGWLKERFRVSMDGKM